MSERLGVRKTYKLVLNGAFPRSESGRSYEVLDAAGALLANAAQASRKDLRDAVRAARAAQPGWWGASAYNRGQVLYRVAEMAEARREELVDQVVAAEGVERVHATATVERAIDRIVWFAGWTDKIAQVYGGTNPVAGPYFNFSIPSPSGVVGVVAPAEDSLLGLVETVMAPICAGNAVVVLASETRPIPAVLLGEMAATSDLPAGVLNVLTGRLAELAPVLADHEDVDGLDLAGAGEMRADLAARGAGSIKRVLADDPRDPDAAALRRIRAFLETTTVWHTIGQ